MPVAVYIVDTFISGTAKGSPTGVCITANALANDEMLSITRQLNFAVTAFIYKKTKGDYYIQYCTTTTSIAACGHATLAAAKIVFETGNTAVANFITVENTLIKVRSQNRMVIMTYPKYELESCIVPQQMRSSLNLQQYNFAGYCKELQTLFIELDNAAVLKNIQPNFEKLMACSNTIKEVVLTCAANGSKFDYLLRSFCPWIGINEDPVTGSVHTVLAGYWQQRTGKNTMKAYQASAAGGEVFVTAFSDKTELGGNAIIRQKAYL